MPRLSFPGGASQNAVLWTPSVDPAGPLLIGETNGLAIDFTNTAYYNTSVWQQAWNQVRTASVDTFSSPHTFYTQSGTSPKVVMTSSTGLGWSPHNLVLRSQQLDNASWTKSNSTISADATTAPDGSSTADKIVEASDTSKFHVAFQSVTTVSGIIYTLSAYAKAAGRNYAAMEFYDHTGANGIYAGFQLTSSGTVVTSGAYGTGYTKLNATITSVGSGWYRITLTGTGNDTTSSIQLEASIDGTVTAYNGDGSSGTYYWGAQFERGLGGTAYIATTSAIVYGLPISYGEGLLIEPVATNLATQGLGLYTTSNAWDILGLDTITANFATAPDGTTTASKSTGGNNASNAQGWYSRGGAGFGGITISSGATYTVSVYLKAGTNNYAFFGLTDAQQPNAKYFEAVIDLTNGTINQTSTGLAGSVYTSSSVVSVGNGWYRAIITGSLTVTTAYVVIGQAQTSSGNTFTGNGNINFATTNTLLAWGAQLETGSVATSVIPTLGSTVTRATDAVNVATSAYNRIDATGTYIAWIQKRIAEAGQADRVFDTEASAGNEQIQVFVNTADSPDSFGLSMTAGGVSQVDPTVTKTGSANTSGNKIAIAYAANNSGIVVDAGSEVTDASCTMPSPNTLYLGYAGNTASRELNGFIKRFIYVPRRMTTTQMQAKTT